VASVGESFAAQEHGRPFEGGAVQVALDLPLRRRYF